MEGNYIVSFGKVIQKDVGFNFIANLQDKNLYRYSKEQLGQPHFSKYRELIWNLEDEEGIRPKLKFLEQIISRFYNL